MTLYDDKNKIKFSHIINNDLIKALEKQNIFIPTDIQAKTIPIVLEKKDAIISSETGSGKTLAYILPILERLDKNIKYPQAVILAPTHELASQIYKQTELIIKNSSGYDWINPALIIGGANIKRQMEKLKEKPRILIGSIGRILELVKLKKLKSHYVKTIVLDEADRLLNDNNIYNIQQYINTTLKDRQILLYSASIDQNTINIASKFMNSPQIIYSKTKYVLPESIEHIYFICSFRDKIKLLRKIISAENIQNGIIFINNPNNENIVKLTETLNYHGITCKAIYGNMKKFDRKQTLDNFRNKKIRFLVSSDLSCRGLDFPDLTHVINYDIPEDEQIYLHRAGRCGRMGKNGLCISLTTENQVKFIKKIEKYLGIVIEQKEMSYGKIVNRK